jgi:alcohol dehydrogenase class IV
MQSFTDESLPSRVVFGWDALARLPEEIDRLSAKRILVLAVGLRRLAERIGAPVALKDIGMPHDGIDRAANQAVANPYWNPRPLEREAIRTLIDDAWHGRQPGASPAG